MSDNVKYYRVHERDTVAVCLEESRSGDKVDLGGLTLILRDTIPFGHKFALADIVKGDAVIRYGHPIGVATHDIQAGEWVHNHNLQTGLSGLLDYAYAPTISTAAPDTSGYPKTFMGYRRRSGVVGTRNELWILPTVSCVNVAANVLAEEARKRFSGLCDGIYALPHNAGCSQLGEDFARTQRILAAIAHHPNAGGVLILSLGCENNSLPYFRPVLGDIDESRVKFLVAQDVEDEHEEGLRRIEDIVRVMAGDERVECPAGALTIGFKCGGSDALSGVTANPLCGMIANRIAECGGRAILTEVPEMFGAETILMNRASDRETFDKIVALVNSFKQYYIDHDQPIYENPAPGNKDGGITTLEEKSLGCIQKGGNAVVTDTLEYGESAVLPGLNLLTGPGNDNVSITNLMSSGSQIILFTTGRGNPLGTAVPCVKISSNDNLYKRKPHWIDFNAGELLDGKSAGAMTDALWELVLATASGERRACNEINGYREIMIFKDGVLL